VPYVEYDAKLIENTEKHLEPEERVLASVLGFYQALASFMGDNRAIVVATDRRVLVNQKIPFPAWGYALELIPYPDIISVEQSSSVRGHKLNISRILRTEKEVKCPALSTPAWSARPRPTAR
jgi:hypothetical protein